jgi:peptidoglycan/LPS O-acetylase OafA/YrhL
MLGPPGQYRRAVVGVAVADRDDGVDASAPSTGDRRRVEPGRPAYRPGLDGLRGLAVAAVVAYHLGFPWAKGGYLGVDTFLVLSGYLITTGLVWEHASSGRIALGKFWVRRAQRLLPALLVLLAAAGVYAAVVALPDEAHALRLDALSALGFFSNWRFVLTGQGYFAESAAPSLLRHTWSLAVEGQLYLVWPLVVVVVSRWRPRRLWVVAVGLATASAGLGAILVAGGHGFNRAYYGTDTRAVSFLVGAALAATLASRARPPVVFDGGGAAARALGLTGLAGLVVTAGLWATLSGTSAMLWRGALPLAGLATAAVIADVVLHPAGRLSRALSTGPLRRLGAVSYGVYLWHWPLILVLDHQRTGLSGLALLAVRLGATAGATTASWFAVERPILQWRRAGRSPSRQLEGPAIPATPAGPPQRLGRCAFGLAAGTVVISVAVVAALVVVPARQARSSTLSVQGFTARLGPVASPRPLAVTGSVPAVVFGDSVAVTLAAGMLPVAASYHVALGNGAEIGCGVALGTKVRSLGQVSPVPAACRSWASDWQHWVDVGRPAVSIILLGRWELLDRQIDGRWEHLGDAGFDDYVAGQLDQAIDIAQSGGGTVVLCTAPYFDGVERPQGGRWPENTPARVQRFNQLVRAAVARHPKAVLFDLNGLVSPGGHFASVVDGQAIRSDDGVHFSAQGGAFVASHLLTFVAALGRRSG